MLNSERLNPFPLIRTKKGYLLSLLFNNVLDILTSTIREEEKNKGICIGAEEVKLSLFIDNIIIYLENFMKSTKMPLELRSCLARFQAIRQI